MPHQTLNDGLFRVSGMYGEARDSTGVLLAEVIEVSASVEINRIEVPLVGTTKTGYKPGRESREGTFRIQKIDTYWEMQVYGFLNQSLADRRSKRGTHDNPLKPFTLTVGYDDPDALGWERWQLDGCIIWRLPLGFNIGDDIRELEFPFTWERETPLAHFERTSGTNPVTGLPAVTQTSPQNS